MQIYMTACLTFVKMPCNKEFCWDCVSWLVVTGSKDISGYGGGGGSLGLEAATLSACLDMCASSFLSCLLLLSGRMWWSGLFRVSIGLAAMRLLCCMFTNCTSTSLKESPLGRPPAWICWSRSNIAFWFWKFKMFLKLGNIQQNNKKICYKE